MVLAATLQQRVSQGESLVAFENVVECIELVRFELIRWTETEPTHVDALDAWPTANMRDPTDRSQRLTDGTR